MTRATIRPLARPVPEREERRDELAELLTTLADLEVCSRSRRARLLDSPDPRAEAAVQQLAALERHAHEVCVEAARVHNELQHARLL